VNQKCWQSFLKPCISSLDKRIFNFFSDSERSWAKLSEYIWIFSQPCSVREIMWFKWSRHKTKKVLGKKLQKFWIQVSSDISIELSASENSGTVFEIFLSLSVRFFCQNERYGKIWTKKWYFFVLFCFFSNG
jgi:hypothetical protein